MRIGIGRLLELATVGAVDADPSPLLTMCIHKSQLPSIALELGSPKSDEIARTQKGPQANDRVLHEHSIWRDLVTEFICH